MERPDSLLVRDVPRSGCESWSWEQDLHLYYKRAKADEVALGDGAEHRELVARAALDGA